MVKRRGKASSPPAAVLLSRREWKEWQAAQAAAVALVEQLGPLVEQLAALVAVKQRQKEAGRKAAATKESKLEVNGSLPAPPPATQDAAEVRQPGPTNPMETDLWDGR